MCLDNKNAGVWRIRLVYRGCIHTVSVVILMNSMQKEQCKVMSVTQTTAAANSLRGHIQRVQRATRVGGATRLGSEPPGQPGFMP